VPGADHDHVEFECQRHVTAEEEQVTEWYTDSEPAREVHPDFVSGRALSVRNTLEKV
jgi:hypothetical protein